MPRAAQQAGTASSMAPASSPRPRACMMAMRMAGPASSSWQVHTFSACFISNRTYGGHSQAGLVCEGKEEVTG